MEEEFLLTPMKFSDRINKYAIVPFHFMIFFEHADLRERIQNHRMKELDELNEQFTPKMYPNKTPAEVEVLKLELRARLQATTYQEVDEYLPILYNQALVMMVTVFDVFLYESLRTVTSKCPVLLKSMADEKDMTIVQILELADYQAIFEAIQSRVLRRFDYKGILEKIEALRKLRVDVDAALHFKFLTSKVQGQYSNSLELLRDSYDRRHAIVHREQHTFDSFKQLEEVGLFLGYLVKSFSFALGFRFGIMTDWERFTQQPHPQRPRLPTVGVG
jgi:hypothetical protein